MSQAAHFNIAETILRRHPDAIYRIAIDEMRCAGTNTYTFGGLDYLSDKFANTLQESGVKPGEVVAIILPQSVAFIVAHFGVLKLGAIVAPVATTSETTFFKQLIQESHTRAIVIDESFLNQFEEALDGFQDKQIFVVTDIVSKNNYGNGYKGFWYEINFADSDFHIADTNESTLAYYFYGLNEKQVLRKAKIDHGAILRASQRVNNLKSSSRDPENSIQTFPDWASMMDYLDEVLPSLYQGQRTIAL